MVQVRTVQPIIDLSTGETLVQAGACGEALGYHLDTGNPAYIPLHGTPDVRLQRRLKIEVEFPEGIFFLAHPEQVDFETKIDLLAVLLIGKEIVDITELTPRARFQQVVTKEPFAFTLHTEEFKLTFEVDNTSGLLNFEMEACE